MQALTISALIATSAFATSLGEAVVKIDGKDILTANGAWTLEKTGDGANSKLVALLDVSFSMSKGNNVNNENGTAYIYACSKPTSQAASNEYMCENFRFSQDFSGPEPLQNIRVSSYEW